MYYNPKRHRLRYQPSRPSSVALPSQASDASSGDPAKGAIATAFLGTYSPRRCGIASFTGDLVQAVVSPDRRVKPMVLAVTEPSGQYQYPPEVEFEIRQNTKADYARAAEFVNYSEVQLVSIQHEYGIFGGDDGSYILDFLDALRVPAVVTVHTVLKDPSSNQVAIVRQLALKCARVIVMSEVARDLLVSSYGVRSKKLRVIPHGIPVMERRPDQGVLKAKFGVSGQRLLLTFGLLSPNKGIETVIRALPAVVRAFPDVVYFVVGATHPVVLRREGETYRTLLEREAERLGVREHVMFRAQFVSNDELRQYLQAADIFVSPYLNEVQVTSGALSYAMGAGATVVSTPYWHAQELLADGRGCLFPFKDHVALAQTLRELLGSPARLRSVRTAALGFARASAWPRVGDTYFEMIGETLQAVERRPARAVEAPEPARSLPELCLDHLQRMTDDTGIIQHATFSVPARRTGYCVDDNARALIVAVHADRLHGTLETRRLVTTYLSYLHASQTHDGSFRNFMSYQRVLESAPPSDDCIGRAIWALGVSAELAEDEGCRQLARDMLRHALPHARALGPRGSAQTILGLAAFLGAERHDAEARALLDALVAELLERYRKNASSDWRWFEPSLTYDNAILPLALFAAYGVTGERSSLRDARESLEFLEEICFEGDRLQLVGNTGWHSRGGEKACADEQAIDAAAFVLAFRGAYSITKDRHYLRRMRDSFAWFLGSNRLGLPLYDFTTGGCRDGIGMSHINQNQGAESTICFLISLLHMLQLAGDGIESGERPELSDN